MNTKIDFGISSLASLNGHENDTLELDIEKIKLRCDNTEKHEHYISFTRRFYRGTIIC